MTISELAEFDRLIFTLDTDPDPKNVPLIQAAKKARDHISRDLANPHKDKTCQQCNWTNVGCLNLGEPNGESFWMCHGCIKRMRDEFKATREMIARYLIANRKVHKTWIQGFVECGAIEVDWEYHPYYPGITAKK